MRMEAGLDTGDYCICRTTAIENKTTNELTIELAHLGACATLTALTHIEQGVCHWESQDESFVTYAHKIEKHELNLSECDTCIQAFRKQRASSEAHPCKIVIGNKTATLLEVACVNAGENNGEGNRENATTNTPSAGQVIFAHKKLILGLKQGALEIKSIKPDGKSEMSGTAFASGIQGIKKGNITWSALHA